MAVFGSLESVRAQLTGAERLPALFAHLAACLDPQHPAAQPLHALAAGETVRRDFPDGIFALEQAYLTRPRAEGRMESHRRYVDVQLVVAGEERFAVRAIDALTLAEDRTPGQDLLFYQDDPAASLLCLGPGQAAVFFPADGHLPGIAAAVPDLVRKVVVKIPLSFWTPG